MPYTINKTNGGYLTTISDGNLESTSTALTLIGKNYPGYGEILNENFVKLLENFAGSSAPKALPGQLWWDTATKTLKVNMALDQWKIISGSTASSTEPANKTIGDLWFDTLAAQLKVFNGSTWTLIGPSYSSSIGTSGAVVDSIPDDGGVSHVVIKFIIGGSYIVAIVSKDDAFEPQSPISGFATINPGITLNSGLLNGAFYGTASNADKLDNLNNTSFMRTDTASTGTDGTLAVRNDTGLSVGIDGDLRLAVSGSDSYITSNTSNGDIIFRVNKNGSSGTSVLLLDGQSGEARLPATPPASNNSTQLATTAYVDRQANLAASSSGFASGTRTLFVQSAAPTGWTKVTTHNNKALRVVSGNVVNGGTVDFTTAFASQAVTGTVGYQTVSGSVTPTALEAQHIPAHAHLVSSAGTAGTNATLTGSNYIDSYYTSYDTKDDYYFKGTSVAPTLGLSSSVGGSQAHGHSFTNQGNHNHSFTGTNINLAVAYVDVIIAQKD